MVGVAVAHYFEVLRFYLTFNIVKKYSLEQFFFNFFSD